MPTQNVARKRIVLRNASVSVEAQASAVSAVFSAGIGLIGNLHWRRADQLRALRSAIAVAQRLRDSEVPIGKPLTAGQG